MTLSVTTSIAKIVQSIMDSQNATIKLTLAGGNQIHLSCVYKEDQSPNFLLLFPPNILPENIDLKAKHPVSIRHKNSSISLSTSIIEQKGDRSLFLAAHATMDPAGLREYFRVNTAIAITASFEPSSKGENSGRGWSITGQTQDLSGSGVLALLPEEPTNDHNIFIDILIPTENKTIQTLAHIVRKKRLRSKRWQVSFHFDNISDKHRDLIITYLLSEQRKQLRERVRALDS